MSKTGPTIVSAKFIKGITGPTSLLESETPQIAFIGRSNVGKSSLINVLTKQKKLAITSSNPGRTREINVFAVKVQNETLRADAFPEREGGSRSETDGSFFLLDLPGYGYAKVSKGEQEKIMQLIHWYLISSNYVQKKVVLIIDALVGFTSDDLDTLAALEEAGKSIVIIANKVDKIKSSVKVKHMRELRNKVMDYHTMIEFSSEKKIGIKELEHVLFG